MTTVSNKLQSRATKQDSSGCNLARPGEKEPQVEHVFVLPGLIELQAAIQRVMEEMARFSGTLSALQSDVSSCVKTMQGKMKSNMRTIFQ